MASSLELAMRIEQKSIGARGDASSPWCRGGSMITGIPASFDRFRDPLSALLL